MTLSKSAETGISLAIPAPELSLEVSLLIPTYTHLYRVIPKMDILGYLITRDIPALALTTNL